MASSSPIDLSEEERNSFMSQIREAQDKFNTMMNDFDETTVSHNTQDLDEEKEPHPLVDLFKKMGEDGGQDTESFDYSDSSESKDQTLLDFELSPRKPVFSLAIHFFEELTNDQKDLLEELVNSGNVTSNAIPISVDSSDGESGSDESSQAPDSKTLTSSESYQTASSSLTGTFPKRSPVKQRAKDRRSKQEDPKPQPALTGHYIFHSFWDPETNYQIPRKDVPLIGEETEEEILKKILEFCTNNQEFSLIPCLADMTKLKIST